MWPPFFFYRLRKQGAQEQGGHKSRPYKGSAEDHAPNNGTVAQLGPPSRPRPANRASNARATADFASVVSGIKVTFARRVQHEC